MTRYGYKGLNEVKSRIESQKLKEKGRRIIKDFNRRK